jgi:ABC-type bacteriocin/lantibiotic exporters, contain an N-terminal double-glycine peptidase domain
MKSDDKKRSISNLGKTSWILRKTMQNCFPYVAVYALILLAVTLLQLAVSVVNKEIVNQLTKDMQDHLLSKTFIGLVVLYLFFYFLEKTSGFMGAYGANFFQFQVDGFFQRMFMWKCSILPQEYFFKTDFMDQFTLVSQHIGNISSYIRCICGLLFSNIGFVMGMMVLFAVYEPFLILYASVVAVVSLCLNRYISKCEYDLNKKQVRNQRKENYFNGLLTGRESAKEMRIYHLSGYLMEKWRKVYVLLRQEYLDMNIKRTKLWNRQSRFLLYIRIPAILLLFAGIMRERYDVGTFVMLFGLVKSCGEQMNSLAYNIVQGTYKDTKYLGDYYDFIQPITDAAIRELKKDYILDRKLALGSFESLELQRVSYTYPSGEKKAVDNVSLTIKKGEVISILGYNGSGKTTLSKLINGSLKPQDGRILINGIPLGEKSGNVFPYFGNMPQEYSKFSIPIKDHVGIGRIEQMDQESARMDSYRKVELDNLIAQYQQGENTILGKEYEETGINLSGGEWQRVILASAYMGEPEILLLDEPSASIDSLKENAMLENLKNELRGKTAILISHRIAFARLADRIIMMKDGKIAEEGSHEELLLKKGYYAEFFEKQKELYWDREEEKT